MLTGPNFPATESWNEENMTDYVGGTFDVTILAGMTNTTLSEVSNVGTFQEDNEFFKAILSIPEGTNNVLVGVDTAFVEVIWIQ